MHSDNHDKRGIIRKHPLPSITAADFTVSNNPLFERKLELATEGLEPSSVNKLKTAVSNDNALIIANYIIAMKTEINPSDKYRINNIQTLAKLSQFFKNQISFKQMTRDNILLFLDSYRKTDAQDSMHHWIGSYNLLLVMLIRFFKWLYYPQLAPMDRKIKPEVVDNIFHLKRKEQSIYKPSDLWTREDDVLFLKHCPSKRMRCYHAISIDTSCRPHEILKLRIKDIVFKTSGHYQYAEVLVNGKTGSRSIPLFDSIPYVKDWLDEHPLRGNANSFLISGIGRSIGRAIEVNTLSAIYKRRYKEGIFPKLISNPSVSSEDKQKIMELLKKPWNPYIRRHSALTEKSTILKEHVLRQHAGWSISSSMPQKYLHYFGNESSESLLEAYGIVTKDLKSTDALKPKQCPNCNEPNKPDSKFCAKCRMVLTYDAYNETVEEKEDKGKEIDKMKEQMRLMQESQTEILALLKEPSKLMAALNEK